MSIDKDVGGVTFKAALYDIRTKRDGGGRLTLDFGADALEDIQYVQSLASKGEVLFQIAIVPLPPQVIQTSEEEVDF